MNEVTLVGMTTESFIEKAKLVHGDTYDYSEVVYRNVKAKVRIICRKHGVFEQTPDKHLHGPCGCPVCAGNQRYDTKTFIEKAESVHGDRYDYSLTRYINNKTHVKIVCKIHGVFEQSPANHLSGKGCPICANNVPSTTEAFIQRAKAVHGDKYDYSLVEYVNNRTLVKIRCLEHGVFEQTPYSHFAGCGCPVCGRLDQVEHRDEAAIRSKAEQTCLERYGVSNPMDIPDVRERHKRVVQSDDVRKKRYCTKRENNSFNTSLPEYRLGRLLKSLFGDDDVLDNYVSDVYPFKCDFYIKSRDMYIELNAHWSHGRHWFTECDRPTVDSWSEKSKFYQNAAVTFSVRDVEKRAVAQQNNLNYVVFWKSDLSDVRDWIDRGCPDGRDWLKEYSWLS